MQTSFQNGGSLDLIRNKNALVKLLKHLGNSAAAVIGCDTVVSDSNASQLRSFGFALRKRP